MKNKSISTIILGVTGSIAAYKAADLTSRLCKKGANLYVIMTESAEKLICPQTFLTLSRNPVISSLWSSSNWQPRHIQLADEADLFLIAPATANFIGKYANGIADDALTTFALAFEGKVIVAPAMNPRMWRNPAVQENILSLKKRGAIIVEPEEGIVACGDYGRGRLANLDAIEKAII
ncbi:MAG: flavoprotein [Verrucomicrobiota bacterium]|nr:flavoprotein [Verrucomicrobiota bacterium]